MIGVCFMTFASFLNAQTTFMNKDTVIIPGIEPVPISSKPYPSNIIVSGMKGMVSDVKVTLNNFWHNYPDAVDMLLVAPDGTNATILSDVGGATDINGIDITLDDEAANPLPDYNTFSAGTYQPTNMGFGPDSFLAPAPRPLGKSALSTFNGVDPNGTWKLYVVSDVDGGYGLIAGGWSLTITTIKPSQPVKVTDLNATYNSQTSTVDFSWKTDFEYNSAYFVVERSYQGSGWDSIGKVDASGFTTTGDSYHFTDPIYADGNYLYRIKTVFKDQSVKYSYVAPVNVKTTKYTAFPNPTRVGYTYITSDNTQTETVTLTLMDMNKNVLIQKQGTVSMFSPLRLDLNSIRPGTYYILITNATRQTVITLIVN